MNIALNMFAPTHGGGFFTYNYNILKGILSKNDNNEYYIFVNEESIDSFSIPNSKNIHILTVSAKFSITILRYLWMQIVLPVYLLYKNIDILLSPTNITPILTALFGTRTILVHHTNLPWLFPEDVPGSKFNLFFLKFFIWFSLNVSKVIIVNSITAKKELTRVFPKISRKIKTIYLGLDKNRFNKNNDNTFFLNDKIDIRKDNYFLSISGAVRYHCLKELIIAYDNLNCNYDNIPKLLLISKNLDQKYYNEIKELIRTRNSIKNIILIEGINSDFIPSLYNNADLYIFSSYCEVFGLTNLEAMSCGVPVLTANKSAMPEICGDGALYFNPHDPDDIKNKIVDLYFNENLKKKMIIQGYKQASIYSWQNTCAQVKSLILEGNNYTGGKNV